MKFKAGDIILVKREGNDFISKIVNWAIGEWGHAAIYYDETKRTKQPLLIESIGRGVQTRLLSDYGGYYIAVVQHEDSKVALKAADEACRIANDSAAWYDYWDLPRFVVPRIIWYKLFGERLSFGYRHNNFFICSELVNAAYDYPIPESWGEALPGDFLNTLLLPKFKKVWEGRYKEEDSGS